MCLVVVLKWSGTSAIHSEVDQKTPSQSGLWRFHSKTKKRVGGWFGTFYFSICRECHHPNWPNHIFQRGRSTSNQGSILIWSVEGFPMMRVSRFPFHALSQEVPQKTSKFWHILTPAKWSAPCSFCIWIIGQILPNPWPKLHRRAGNRFRRRTRRPISDASARSEQMFNWVAPTNHSRNM